MTAMPQSSAHTNPFPTPKPQPPLRRFWNETVRLPSLFEQGRASGDHANALVCFGRMAQHAHWELTRKPDYKPAQKSIITAFQAKAGSTYLHNRLLQYGYQEFQWFYSHPNCLSVCYASVEALELFLVGGCICHSHVRPVPNILNAFDRAGVEKIWVHLRNPAESVVSSYHHYLGEGHGEGDVGRLRQQIALAEAARQGLIPGMSKSKFVVENIGWYVEWVVQWLRFAADHPGLVVFSYYPELLDPQALLSRVFHELGIECPGSFSARLAAHDRYRKKTTNDWRHDLTPAAQNYLELRVKADLQDFPAFERLWR